VVSAALTLDLNGRGSVKQSGKQKETSGVAMSCKNTGLPLFDTMTFERSEPTTSSPLTLSAEDSPAPTSRLLAEELASRVLTAAFGSSISASFASFDRDSWSLKTSQRSVLEDSTGCSLALPKAGTMRCGFLYELPTLVRRTSGRDCSSSLGESAWPTPTRCGNYNRKGLSATSGDGLATAVSWPTPTSRDWKDGDCRNADVEQNGLLGRVALTDQPKGSLNPAWVEVLQGFPQGWTGLPEEVKPSTTGNRRESRATSRNDVSDSKRSGTRLSRKSRTQSG
jgi:hypothetical protein